MKKEKLTPHVLSADTLLAEFAKFRSGHPNNYEAERDAADRDTLQALTVIADAALVFVAITEKTDLTTIRRRFRQSITSSLASVEGSNDG